MSDFTVLGKAVNAAFNTMLQSDGGNNRTMFIADITGDELWDAYIAAFPEGTNPMFRTRTENECSCCRSFVRNIGNVVFVKDGQVFTVWDINIPEDGKYSVVAKTLAELVRSKAIKSRFYVGEPKYGAPVTNTNGETWNHFHAVVPRMYITRNAATNALGEANTDVALLKRSLEEISSESISMVLELMAQNSLYRGAEFKPTVTSLKTLKAQYDAITDDRAKELFLWTTAKPATRFKNTVIGTLLVDLSEGTSLDGAVGAFEAKVAPANYKRPTALVTQRMIDDAKKVVEALGIEPSLARRYATKEDMSVNNVLFVDGTVKPLLLGGAFDTIKPTAKASAESKNVEDISSVDFFAKVLPLANEIEVFLKSQHLSNFVSLIAPVNAEAPPLMKWDNAFSWSYDGEVTDSIKERVKRAGGKVDGAMRVSLSWHNGDDLDLHVKDGREHVYFASKRGFGAVLDVDMNAGGPKNSTDPVENVVWAREQDIRPGVYEVYVNNFNKRSTSNVGFTIEVEVLGKLYSFTEDRGLSDKQTVNVGSIKVDKNGNVTVSGFVEGTSSTEKWGVSTEAWTPVDMITLSPNFWDGKQVGNQHVFFMLKNCLNPEGTRGFYNEFLRDDLQPQRKVFELLSASLKVAPSNTQLSGIGISTTKRDTLLVRVKGSITRVLNVTF